MVDQINHHLYRKRGFYYFSRRVPKALLGDYPKPRIVLALKTRHYRDALRQSQILSKRLDDQWFHMQLDAMGLDNVQAKIFQPVKGDAPLMSEATAFQKDLKTHNWHNFSYDGYGGFFHTDLFNADKKRMILAMDGFGGQMIVIDFDEERIVVTNAIYNNFHWKKIVRDVIKTGKIR